MGNRLGALCLNGFVLVKWLFAANYFDSLNCVLSSGTVKGLRVKMSANLSSANGSFKEK